MQELKEYASEGVHDAVVSCMETMDRGLTLDVPAGQGRLSREFERLGFKVFSGDLERSNILYKTGRNVQLNLNNPLPFKDGTFDYVVCIEGIEHLEAPHSLIRGFSRVLKEGGRLIISTPNVMTIKSRIRFLFCSHLDYFRYFGPLPDHARYRIEEHEHLHINPISYSEMRYLLETCGFRLEDIRTNRLVRKRGFFLHPLLKKLIRYKTRKRLPWDSFYLNDTLLEGDDLIFVAKKESGAGPIS